jgi:protein O-mannosyl-transferase
MRRSATRIKPAPMRAATLGGARPRFPVWLLAAMLLLVTLTLYWPATRSDFVNYDDDVYVTSNMHVKKGLTWENMIWACMSPVCCNWHPLTVWSHMLICQLAGLNPWGHHLTNILLHTLNAGLVFALLRQMTGATWRSLLVAALFAVHPLRVESVAWVSERKDVLSGCFGLLALMAYARYAQARSLKSGGGTDDAGSGRQQPGTPNTQHASRFTFPLRRRDSAASHVSGLYLLSLGFFALGLLSKPMLVTWPFVMLLLDYWPLGRMQNAECRMRNAEAIDTQHATHITFHGSRFTVHVPRKVLLVLLVEKIPFFVLAALASVMTFVVQQREGSLESGLGLSFSARLANALISYCRHLGKLFWPTDLTVFYPHPGHWPLAKVLLAAGVMLCISVLVWVGRRRAPFLLMGWLWFVGILVPVIGLVQTGAQAMADRHTYLPSIGALVLAVWGAYELTRRWQYGVRAWSVAGGAALVLCLALTRQLLGYWQDGEALFRHALAVTENNYLAYNNLGYALAGKGQLDEAIRHYQEAIRLKPDQPDFHANLGVAFARHGQLEEAVRQFQEAIRLKPDHSNAHYNLGTALDKQGQLDEAIRQYREAVRLKPDYADARNNLGAALNEKGQTDEAIHQLREAIRLDPDQADAHNNLGIALGLKGQTDEAIGEFQEAVRLKPDYADAHNNLGVARNKKGQLDEAIRQFQEALRFKPGYADAQKNLDLVLATKAQGSPPPSATTNP